VIALLWLFAGDSRPKPPRRASGDVDHDELERAERDVQEAGDEDNVRDWGPGTGHPPGA
jgi:hypothetical protein